MPTFGTREDYKEILGEKGFIGSDSCPFCIREHHEAFIVWEGTYWKIIYNKYPYSGNDQNIMAMPIRHIMYHHDLNSEELGELGEVYKIIKLFYGNQRYFSACNESIHHRSIEHLHIHFLPGDLEGKYIQKMLKDQGFPVKGTVTER